MNFYEKKYIYFLLEWSQYFTEKCDFFLFYKFHVWIIMNSGLFSCYYCWNCFRSINLMLYPFLSSNSGTKIVMFSYFAFLIFVYCYSSSKAIILPASPSSSLSSSTSSPSTFVSSSSALDVHRSPESKCRIYSGKLCSQFIGNRSIYLEPEISQEILEDNLAVLFEMIATSHQISHQCHRFAISSVCFFNFPVCRTEPSGQLVIRKVSPSSFCIKRNINGNQKIHM